MGAEQRLAFRSADEDLSDQQGIGRPNKVMKIQLVKIAHARSGDKGDTANVGIIAHHQRHYPILVREVTAERVKAHFGDLVRGDVRRYELDNIEALNFVLEGALDGGGTRSLRIDPLGKSLAGALLYMEWE